VKRLISVRHYMDKEVFMATTRREKFTSDQIKEHVAKIRKVTEEVEKRKKSGENVTVITPEEIEEKLKRVNSPMIVFQSWAGSTAAGGTFNYNIGIYNPDPTQAIWVFVHNWVGSGNVDPVVGTFLLNVDPRFPRQTQPDFAGLSINPSTQATLTFSIHVPANVEHTNYLGNSCLMQFNWHDVGTYLDRSVFVFKVT